MVRMIPVERSRVRILLQVLVQAETNNHGEATDDEVWGVEDEAGRHLSHWDGIWIEEAEIEVGFSKDDTHYAVDEVGSPESAEVEQTGSAGVQEGKKSPDTGEDMKPVRDGFEFEHTKDPAVLSVEKRNVVHAHQEDEHQEINEGDLAKREAGKKLHT